MSTPQRPRPVHPGPQHRGELVEEIAHPGSLDGVDGHAINARSSVVSTNLAPGSAHDVAAGDLVKQSMETTITILLGTAVKHALESTNTIRTKGAADRPSH
jgi:hypothetical protein